ncbi:MAG TPA: DNA-binding response regulator [Lachnospiraceae bacterium]|jgi:DNA-binding response OmpR family regulator|nr:DNA-binding response regulator [Lachnospiraceae bacterium]
MANRILVVEDDTAISELICMNLEVTGYEVVPVLDGNEVEGTLEKEENFDLALLDIMLPGKDGFELLGVMKEYGIPVIYITAKADVNSKIKGLRSGAEDYIVKPFEVLELLVRVEKVLERTGKQKEIIQVKDLEIHLSEHKVTRNGQTVSLKPMEYDLLVLLAKNKNVAFTREQMLNEVWGSNYLGETRTIDVHIGQLRRKLDLSDVIKTIPKIGYRLEE